MNYTVIILVFVIVIMLYMAYVYYTNTTLTTGVVKLTDIITGRTGNSTNWNKLVNPGAITYHYEGWLFVNTLPSAKKAIFWKDTNGVALCLDNSTLTVDTVTQVTAGTNSGPNAFGPPPLVTVTEKFPQQKWVYFVVNVINQNVVEVYLNGKLIQTKQLASPNKVPNNTRGTLYLGGTATVDGYVTKFKRDPVALLPDEVWKNYLAGNGLATFTNWLAGYNASFSVHSGTEEIMKKSLFT